MRLRLLLPAAAAVLLAACGSTPSNVREGAVDAGKVPVSKGRKVATPRGGGYYLDDGPADETPENLGAIPDALPKWEPLYKPAMKPYDVLGKHYVPMTSVQPYHERGIASWYGRKFNGQKTSIGEPYDMFAMTAAHPTLAIPSYARVTNVENGRSVIVRVTDRGPFHAGRIIDLSYTAAYKLGLVDGGSGLVDVDTIIPGEPGGTSYAQVGAPTPAPSPAPAPTPAASGEAGEKGIYLQLGAFANPENAENLKAHLANELDGLGDALHIVPGGGVLRLHLGPYASRDEADRVAERIRGTLGYSPTVIRR